MPARKPIAPGTKFSRLTVIGPAADIQRDSGPVSASLCLCECGNKAIIGNSSMRSGNTTSCGCANDGHPKHGMKHTRTYGIWVNMRNRTTNPNHPDYKYYGGRGIKVCDRWNDFRHFFSDMGEAPKDHSINRINNDGDYEPSNCEWASRKKQMQNTRANVIYTAFGVTACLTELARHYGKDYQVVRMRLRRGWDIETAIKLPVFPGKPLRFRICKAGQNGTASP